jgi:hypothetical protein
MAPLVPDCTRVLPCSLRGARAHGLSDPQMWWCLSGGDFTPQRVQPGAPACTSVEVAVAAGWAITSRVRCLRADGLALVDMCFLENEQPGVGEKRRGPATAVKQ